MNPFRDIALGCHSFLFFLEGHGFQSTHSGSVFCAWNWHRILLMSHDITNRTPNWWQRRIYISGTWEVRFEKMRLSTSSRSLDSLRFSWTFDLYNLVFQPTKIWVWNVFKMKLWGNDEISIPTKAGGTFQDDDFPSFPIWVPCFLVGG